MILHRKAQRGFALLIAVIFMSVMLALGLALGSLGYKQEVLASSAIQSQYAFYAADGALECALYADQQQGLFAYDSYNSGSPPQMPCDGIPPVSASTVSYTSGVNGEWVVTTRLSLNGGAQCADVTVYKPAFPSPTNPTYIFSQGYDVSCTTVASPNGAFFSSRGLEAKY